MRWDSARFDQPSSSAFWGSTWALCRVAAVLHDQHIHLMPASDRTRSAWTHSPFLPTLRDYLIMTGALHPQDAPRRGPVVGFAAGTPDQSPTPTKDTTP